MNFGNLGGQYGQDQRNFDEQQRLAREAFLNGQYNARSTIVPLGKYQTICGTWFYDTKGNQIPSFVVKRI